MNLVFASGFLVPQKLLGVPYFRGLSEKYPTALFPKVDVIGSVAGRAQQLADQITARNFLPGDIHIVAHSMGGLDSRYLLAKNLNGLAARVTSLSTVATPHRGSPVADLLTAEIGANPLEVFARDTIKRVLDKFPTIQNNALENLTSEFTRNFNSEIRNVSGVRYYSYTGDDHSSLLLTPTHAFIQAHGRTPEERRNDGVVSVASAAWPDQLTESPWPADHIALIGHDTDTADLKASFDHLAAFDRVVKRALETPARAASR